MWLPIHSSFYVSLGAWVVLLVVLFLEHRRHRRSLDKIALRVHVNGTRGKSSVTRLIAAGLRAGGRKVFAKTTGTSPQLILPDGGEEPLARRGPPGIGENLAFLRRAAREGADAVVVECMALRPDLQRALEHRILKSHIGVITNVRADHEEVMGEGLHAVATALSGTIPSHGIWVTTPETAALMREAGVPACGFDTPGPKLSRPSKEGPASVQVPGAETPGPEFPSPPREGSGDGDGHRSPREASDEGLPITIHPSGSAPGARLHLAPATLPPECLKEFGYEVFEENVSLALAVCEAAGVEASTALRGMVAAAPDSGNVTVTRFGLAGKIVRFVNAFAANDPDSTMLLWRRHGIGDATDAIFFLNARGDRRYRTLQLGSAFGPVHRGPFLVTGDHSFAARRMKACGAARVVAAKHEDCFEALEEVLSTLPGPTATVFGAGNAQGMRPLLERIAALRDAPEATTP